ncbi:MAG: HAD family hydrolase [Ardenticatenaceae bacterium]|nr:HAD family hydrolase [Ardenticatenaceae bacterium]
MAATMKPMTPIQLIAIDLDGTLLADDGVVPALNIHALQQAMAAGVLVVLATGKTRGSATAVIEQLDLKTPGVYCQGLVLHCGDGSVWREETLDRETAVDVITFVEAQQLPYLIYDGARILASSENPYRHLLHKKYHEPLPELAGPLLPQVDDLRINKFLISDERSNDETRARLETLVNGRATVTQAVPEYIELLPHGTSKGKGLALLLQKLGIPWEAVLALGDGENDLEMLQLAGVGVAMGNAAPAVKAVADYITLSNNEAGVATAVTRFVLSPHE